jgi:large subunit ribosomal protein LP2
MFISMIIIPISHSFFVYFLFQTTEFLCFLLDALKQFRLDPSVKMRYAAAYVLATLSGNTTPDVATISKILGSVGIDCDNAKAQKVIDACKGKNIDQIIEAGTKKLSSLPTGGGAAAAAAPAGAAPAAADAKKGAAKEEKKEEKKKEESDEEGDDMVS